MKRVLTHLLLAFCLCSASKLRAQDPPSTETYAAFAQNNLESSLTILNARLALLPDEPSSLSDALDARQTFSDMLTLFVHTIPRGSPDDPYLTIRDTLDLGADGLDELWRKNFLSASVQSKMHETFKNLNQLYATQRDKTVLAADHWDRVDFIPDVRGPADAMLHEYAAALVSSLEAFYATDNGIIDVSSPEGRSLLDLALRKSRVLFALLDYFPKEFEGAKVCASIEAMRARVGALASREKGKKPKGESDGERQEKGKNSPIQLP